METLKKLIRREAKKILKGSSSGGSLGNLDSDREGIWYPPGQQIKLPKESLAGYIQVEDSPPAQDTLGSNKKDKNYTITKKVDYNPVPETKPESENFVEDETGTNIVKSLEERKMKKSQFRRLVKERVYKKLREQNKTLNEGLWSKMWDGISNMLDKYIDSVVKAAKDRNDKSADKERQRILQNLKQKMDRLG